MNTIILLNRTQTILLDLYTEYPTGMLPLLDKPAVIFMLEKLAQQGVTKITLAVSNITIDVVSQLGDGSRYGVELTYLNTDRADDLRWFRDSSSGVFKILDGNLCVDPACSNYIKATHAITAFDDEQSYSVIYLHNPAYALQVIRSGTTRAIVPANPGIQLKKYHHQSHKTLRQNYFSMLDTQLLPQHGAGSLVHSSSTSSIERISGDHIYIGKFCAIHRDCQIHDDVIIGAGSIIDRHVKMNNTVILPGTRVPAHYDLSNSLVSPDWIYNLVDETFSFIRPEKSHTATA